MAARRVDELPAGRWAPGDTALLRYLVRGLPRGAFPTRVISPDPQPALWLPGGTPVKWAGVRGRTVREVPLAERYTQPRSPVDRLWQGEGVLILGRPGRAHAIWHFWKEARFAGWYVQLEDAWRSSVLGFDTADHALDIVVEPDGHWRWKDEDELEVGVRLGFFTAAQAKAFREEGERVIKEWPFPTGWEDWRPDPAWPLPSIPAGWDARERPGSARSPQYD